MSTDWKSFNKHLSSFKNQRKVTCHNCKKVWKPNTGGYMLALSFMAKESGNSCIACNPSWNK